jgi:hypothetical protein
MKILLLILAIPFVISCNSKSGSGTYMSPKMMQQVLLDVNFAEAYSSIVKDSTHRVGSKNYDSLAVYYKAIFRHYSITEDQFKQSLDWYKANPDKLDTMCNNLVNKVIALQTKKP